MRRLGIITLFAALFCFMVAGAAMAYVLPAYYIVGGTTIKYVTAEPGDTIEFKFDDFEIWNDANSNGILDTGDIISGVFKVSSLNNITSGEYGTPAGLMTGNFTYTVDNNATGSTPILLHDEMNIYYNKALSLTNVAGMNVYTGTTDVSDYISGGNSGSLLAAFNGDLTAHKQSTSYTNYASTWPVDTTIATVGYDPINMVENYTSYLWKDWELKSDMTYQDSTTVGWTFTSNDPIRVVFNAPEPATMMLFGAGLFGLGALGRKKSKKNRDEA